MKNKRWKRKAKMLIGECSRFDMCIDGVCRCIDKCPYYNDKIKYPPVYYQLRDLENYFKGRSGNNV